jgi:hypothetical protein
VPIYLLTKRNPPLMISELAFAGTEMQAPKNPVPRRARTSRATGLDAAAPMAFGIGRPNITSAGRDSVRKFNGS